MCTRGFKDVKDILLNILEENQDVWYDEYIWCFNSDNVIYRLIEKITHFVGVHIHKKN